MGALKLDINFINPFIEGVLTTLDTQCSVKAKTGKLFLRGNGTEITPAIAAMIGLTSPVFQGSIGLSFPESTFLKVMGGMLGEEYKEINKDLEDGAGELLNIIFGCAKRVLNDKNYNIDKAIPTIVRGSGLSVTYVGKTAAMILPFTSSVGDFQLEIMIVAH